MKILLLFICFSLSAADDKPTPPVLSRGQSKEVSRKISSIVIRDAHANAPVEAALERTLTARPSDEVGQRRHQVMQQMQLLEDEDESINQNLKDELAKWALQELAERNLHEATERQGERRMKWLASGVAALATVMSIITPFIAGGDGCSDSPTNSTG